MTIYYLMKNKVILSNSFPSKMKKQLQNENKPPYLFESLPKGLNLDFRKRKIFPKKSLPRAECPTFRKNQNLLHHVDSQSSTNRSFPNRQPLLPPLHPPNSKQAPPNQCPTSKNLSSTASRTTLLHPKF